MKLLRILPLKVWVILVSCLFIVVLSANDFFINYELLTYDFRFWLRPPQKFSSDVVIIEISDDTLKNLGHWPLPRDFHASLIDVLSQWQVKAIAFDILFSEPTLYDEMLAQSIKKAGNVYLTSAFYLDAGQAGSRFPAASKEVIADICPLLKEGAAGIGYLNFFTDHDGKGRSVPPFIDFQGELFAHLGIKLASEWLGLDSRNVEFRRNRVIIDNKLVIPVSDQGSFLVNYPARWTDSFTHVSYFQILKSYADAKKGLQPELPPSFFKDKVCFVGLTATGTSDLRATPLEAVYPMVGLQASVFNSIINRKFITDIGAILNALLSLLIFALSLLLCLRLKPLKALLGNVSLALSYTVIAVFLFSIFGLWMDLFFPLLIIMLTYLSCTLYRFLGEIKKRQMLEKELDIARSIQQSFLPQDIKECQGLSIAAFMQPAKFVAGDLYDIVAIDDGRTGVLIGDVSGKGVPAALIMAQTISLFRVFSRQFSGCREVLEKLNKELYGKFQGRFITCLYMIIDTARNKVYVSSAGHSPVLHYKQSTNELVEADLDAGLPLGIMEESEYPEVSFGIERMDKLIVFTDGVSEARNSKQEEFGSASVKAIIQEGNRSCEQTAEQLKKKLFTFISHAPQHDDITLIVMAKEKK